MSIQAVIVRKGFLDNIKGLCATASEVSEHMHAKEAADRLTQEEKAREEKSERERWQYLLQKRKVEVQVAVTFDKNACRACVFSNQWEDLRKGVMMLLERAHMR